MDSSHETRRFVRRRTSRKAYPISRDSSGEVTARVNAGAWARDASARNDEGPVVVTRAPGRLDVMGGIADYSGALVLQWPIREATRVALRPWSERRLAIISIGQDGLERRCDVPLDLVGDPRLPYADVRAWFAADPTRHWAAYVAGVFHVLSREHGVQLPRRSRDFRGL